MNENYYFCSQAVVDQFKPELVSKPFKSGFKMDGENSHFIAWLNWDEVQKYHNEVVEPNNNDESKEDIDFWAWEIVPGQIDVEIIDLEQAYFFGLLWEIQHRTGLTKTCNQAMTIYNLAEREGVNPIELINKMLKYE